jgi:hypothetical protein
MFSMGKKRQQTEECTKTEAIWLTIAGIAILVSWGLLEAYSHMNEARPELVAKDFYDS